MDYSTVITTKDKNDRPKGEDRLITATIKVPTPSAWVLHKLDQHNGNPFCEFRYDFLDTLVSNYVKSKEFAGLNPVLKEAFMENYTEVLDFFRCCEIYADCFKNDMTADYIFHGYDERQKAKQERWDVQAKLQEAAAAARNETASTDLLP